PAMAEVSESAAQVLYSAEGDAKFEFDPKTMRRTKPGFKRFTLSVSVLLSFILGLPFLLKSVEIYRSPLPFGEIDELSAAVELSPLHFPCNFRAVFIGFGGFTSNPEELSAVIQSELTASDSTSCGACDYSSTVSVTLVSGSGCSHSAYIPNWKCESLNELIRNQESGKLDDESFDEQLHLLDYRECRKCQAFYTVFVIRREEEEGKVRSVIGKYRHAWILGEVSAEEAVKKVAEIFVKGFVNGWKEEAPIGGEFMPVGADGRTVLSFSLLNADPHDWIYDWDFQRIEEDILMPVVEALKPLADIKIESQVVLYHTPKSSLSQWDDKLRSYTFTKNDLPFFVNSNEWHLDTSIEAGGRSKILHFVVYVPSAAECPLLFRLPNEEVSSTNGFISPMWGGVVVWNPSRCLNETRTGPHFNQKIPSEDIRKIFEVFLAQFRQLFGLKSSHNHLLDQSESLELLTDRRGFTQWEMDVLSRQHTCFNLHQSVTTLGSLSRLVQSLPRMIIKDEIGKQVKYSLEAAKQALSNASDGFYHDSSSVASSRKARSLSEDAFYHPSMVSVSYFSFEHCFAVYSPFFLPVSLHVILAALKEW
ncbi:hypothetical protein M569_09890, partial [Genlisea aurea]